jgi:hypothetical protein
LTELEYVVKHGGLTPKRLLTKLSRRGFGAAVLGGLAGAGASLLLGAPSASAEPGAEAEVAAGAAAVADFTIAIIPDPQFLAGSCPNNLGGYYASMMKWIVNNKNISLTSGKRSFEANIKAVVGVGDCVNLTTGVNEFANAENAWTILDNSGIAFTTPPGNHDYTGGPASRGNLGAQFATGYFSAGNRSRVYGSGIELGGEDMAYWAGSYDSTGANTAVRFAISGVDMLFLAMDFFAGHAAWAWAYDVMLANPNCECYITTHAWLTANGTHFQRTDGYGPNAYSMAAAPYSNSSAEAWSSIKVNSWPNLFGIFGGHDLMGGKNSGASPAWYWQRTPIKSASTRGQTVQQLFINSQELDSGCSPSVSQASGTGQTASVFLLTRRPAVGLLEGRMISTQSGNWFGSEPGSLPGGKSWSTSETLLFSVPFTGLRQKRTVAPLVKRPAPSESSPISGNRLQF